MDTISYAWWPEPATIESFVALPRLIGGSGGSYWCPGRVGGAKIGCWPNQGKVVAEGRLAALCVAPANRHLLPAPAIRLGHDRVVANLASIGINVRDGVLRRCDVAGDLRFSDPADGRALLRAWSGLLIPRHGRTVWESEQGRVQTVYACTPRRGEKRLRMYDKGAEQGSHVAGAWLRLESVRRWNKANAAPLDGIDAAVLRTLHLAVLRPWLAGTSGVAVAAPSAAKVRIEHLRREGRLTTALACRYLGFVDAIERDRVDELADRRTQARWRRELRRLGVGIDSSLRPSSTPIELRPFLLALEQAWRSQIEELPA